MMREQVLLIVNVLHAWLKERSGTNVVKAQRYLENCIYFPPDQTSLDNSSFFHVYPLVLVVETHLDHTCPILLYLIESV